MKVLFDNGIMFDYRGYTFNLAHMMVNVAPYALRLGSGYDIYDDNDKYSGRVEKDEIRDYLPETYLDELSGFRPTMPASMSMKQFSKLFFISDFTKNQDGTISIRFPRGGKIFKYRPYRGYMIRTCAKPGLIPID